MDIQQARFNMVEQQIRTWEVLDQGVLDVLFTVKREDFVPPAYRALAFVDMEIPLHQADDHEIGRGQTMMSPKLEARILQSVAPQPQDRVLEIGTGSGYLTALLAATAGHVTSIEIFAAFSARAASALAQARIHNVALKVGDAANSPRSLIGALDHFDIIVFTGSVPMRPIAYLDFLKPGGRLFAIVGDAPAMKATVTTKSEDGSFASVELFETVVAPLINAQQPSRFHF